jgi:uncharacterized membrane protein
VITATRQVTLSAALAVLVVSLQVAYPLLDDGSARDQLTVLTVLAFLACSATHAITTQGAAWAARLFAVVAGGALAVEAVGVRTGLPFGDYAYADSLGPRLLDVPLAVPLAWAMFAYPALVVGRLVGRPLLSGTLALASWDLFLDPQMVEAGHWRWLDVRVALPGQVPLSNLLGWLLVSLVLMAVLTRMPWQEGDQRVPVGLFLWTWLGSTLANAAFFGRPLVALVGFVGMGLVGVPVLSRRAGRR